MPDPSDRSAAATATILPESDRPVAGGPAADVAMFVIVWCPSEPERVGEVAILGEGGPPMVLGRGPSPDGVEPRMRFARQRPGVMTPTPPLVAPGLSRRQLLVHPHDDGADIERLGQCTLEVNGRVTDAALVRPGDVVHLRRELILYCARRPEKIPALRLFPETHAGAFGEADANGIVGEAPCVWRLRENLAFAAKADTHSLLLGESGTGKELAARAVHHLSARGLQQFVARNAATLPYGIIDAELFGNAKNYPNPGMAERRGLIGEADGGSLFLDEIGELPFELQAHLLRVLDGDGEYQRLGEGVARRSNFRLIAATNRDPSTLKHDFAARFTARIEMPNLTKRREDIPLIARHLLLRAARRSNDIARPFIETTPSGYEYARFGEDLVAGLFRRDFTTNLRELDALLWRAMAESHDDTIEAPPELRGNGSGEHRLGITVQRPSDEPPSLPPMVAMPPAAGLPRMSPGQTPPPPQRPEPSSEEIREALRAQRGRVTHAARALGLSSRYALYRLMKKHGIDSDPPPPGRSGDFAG
jgi:two-component system nitrogen regulation response regulator GlnG/two-component system response regulator HydG